jgi:hypothetical protein
MIARIAREGGCTMEESTTLIAHLEAYIRATAVVDFAPRLAALEAAAAARGDTVVNQIGISIDSTLPRLPGCEDLIMPTSRQIEGAADEHVDAGQSTGEVGKTSRPETLTISIRGGLSARDRLACEAVALADAAKAEMERIYPRAFVSDWLGANPHHDRQNSWAATGSEQRC